MWNISCTFDEVDTWRSTAHFGGHDVLHQVAAVLGLVADRLAEAAGHGEQRELADRVLVGRRGGCRGSGRQVADRQAAEQERTGLVGGVGEVDERIVDHCGQQPGRVSGGTDEQLVPRPRTRAG